MGIGVGLNSYVMTGEEGTWGTGVTPDRFAPITQESVEYTKKSINSNVLIPGKFGRSGDRRAISGQGGQGGFKTEVTTTGMGRIFKHALGVAASPAQQGGSIAWLQTFTVGTVQGKGLTVQKVVRDSASNVLTPLTFVGAKVNTIEFSNSVDNMLEMAVELIGKQVVSNVSAATPTIGSAKSFTFQQGALVFGSTPIAAVKDWSVKLDNKLKTNTYIGNNGFIAEPVDGTDFKEVNGKLSVDFLDQASIYDPFVADTSLSLVITYTGAIIASTYHETFKITVPDIRLSGDTPKIGGPDQISLDVGFDGYISGSNPLLQIDYISSDTAA